MRFTEKDITYITSSANVIEIPDIVESRKYTGQAIIKLGQLEDIEEELGIDLDVFYNLLVQGCYYRFEDEVLYCFEPQNVDATNKYFITPYNTKCYFKDYGKTWALTREELK